MAPTSREFIVYGRNLNMVPSFKYMGRILLAADDDWPEVIQNLIKAREVRRRIERILSREGERLQVSTFFFKAIVHMVLLLGTETWVVTHRMG